MTITIEITRPEIEAMVQKRLHSGAFESVEDVLFDALEAQKEHEVASRQQNRHRAKDRTGPRAS